MSPLLIRDGNHEVLFDPANGVLRMMRDGKGLIQTLSRKDAQALKRALHEYVYPAKG